MRGKLLVVAALLAMLLAAPAYGARVVVTETITPDGDPGLTAASFDAGTLEWRRCTDGGTVCEPLPASVYVPAVDYGRVALPGETPAGTVFEAVATKDGVETKTRTRAWQGRIAPIAGPALQGDAAVGKTVTVAPGTWAGGWAAVAGRATAEPSIFACRERGRLECWLLAYGATAVVDARWAGWYLFAREYVFSDDPVCVPILACVVDYAYQVPVQFELRPGKRAAISAPLGPVASAPHAPENPPRVPKAPSASIRARALRSNGQLLVGRVRCETRCTVQLKVSGGKRRAVYRTFMVMGAKVLAVPVRHGKLKVRVIVDGMLVTSGPTLAR